MPLQQNHSQLRLALPKGRMAEGVMALLDDAGIRVRLGAREYRPDISLPGFEIKILKPQSIVTMLEVGLRDLGFTGADWVTEFGAEAVELLDTGLDPVRLVAAAPHELLMGGQLPRRSLIVASEFERVTKAWIERQGLNATFLRSFGATEVYPPEDADCIVDIVATGATLQANGLQVVNELATSSTRLYASPAALKNPAFRERIDGFVMLLRSVLEARRRVMVEVNVSRDKLEGLVAILPCMREPTIASLYGDRGYAVKVAVQREELPALIPRVKALGGTDVVVSEFSQIVP
ncbi:MAG: ATP phosphoribosyltransferase [Planctomycetota bacterium]